MSFCDAGRASSLPVASARTDVRLASARLAIPGPMAKTVALRILDLIQRHGRRDGALRVSSLARSTARDCQRPGGSSYDAHEEDPSRQRRATQIDRGRDPAGRRVATSRLASLPRRAPQLRSWPPSRISSRIADSLPPEEGWSRTWHCSPGRPVVDGFFSSTSRRPGLLAVQAAMRSSSAVAGSSAAAFTSGNSCSRASRPNGAARGRSEKWPATSMRSLPTTGSRSTFR